MVKNTPHYSSRVYIVISRLQLSRAVQRVTLGTKTTHFILVNGTLLRRKLPHLTLMSISKSKGLGIYLLESFRFNFLKTNRSIGST
jgi:hypothetical protein